MDHSDYREESNKFRDRIRAAIGKIELHNGSAVVLEEEIEKALHALHSWYELGEKHFVEYFQAKYPEKYFEEYFDSGTEDSGRPKRG